MPRGGKRQGREGGNYINRSDMRTTQSIQAAPGQEYGARKAQEDAQRQMPLQNGSGAPTPQPAPQPSVYPGELGALDRPSERPLEPVTAGAASGAGPGMEALGIAPQVDPNQQALEMDLQKMKAYLPSLELLANSGDVSDTTRNLIRRLRGSVPSEAGQ